MVYTRLQVQYPVCIIYHGWIKAITEPFLKMFLTPSNDVVINSRWLGKRFPTRCTALQVGYEVMLLETRTRSSSHGYIVQYCVYRVAKRSECPVALGAAEGQSWLTRFFDQQSVLATDASLPSAMARRPSTHSTLLQPSVMVIARFSAIVRNRIL